MRLEVQIKVIMTQPTATARPQIQQMLLIILIDIEYALLMIGLTITS